MNKKPLDLCDVKTYEDWRDFVQLISSLIPFGVKFFEIYKKLSASGAICNGYYLNYTIEDLTFESLILSAFANFKLGFFEKSHDNKMGITLDEYRTFVQSFLDENLKLKESKEIENIIHDFIEAFGLSKIKTFNRSLWFILNKKLKM